MNMTLRIGIHRAGLQHARSRLEAGQLFGVHVSRAARIEPVTPEGCVYVTETMAAVLALHKSNASVGSMSA
jgi:hypothetical protein